MPVGPLRCLPTISSAMPCLRLGVVAVVHLLAVNEITTSESCSKEPITKVRQLAAGDRRGPQGRARAVRGHDGDRSSSQGP